MGGQEIARAGAELIDEEGAAGAQHAVRRRCNRRADTRRQCRERQAGQHVVGMVEAMRADNLLDVGGAAEHGMEAPVGDRLFQVVDIKRIGVDHDQRAVAPQPVEHRAAEGADAGAIFDEQLGVLPVDRFQHVADQRRRRRHDRPYHDRMLDKAADEHAPRSEKAFEAHAQPTSQRGFLFLGLRPRIGHVGFRVVGALVIDDLFPPPQTQQAIFAVDPAFA